MTVSTTTRKKSYTANGSTTVFAYDFRIFSDSDLKVYVDGTLKTLTTDFSVSGAGESSGGNVTFGSAPADTLSVVILRELPRTQATDYVDNSALSATSLEDTADKNLMLIQEVDSKAGGGFRFADVVVDAGVTTVDKNASDRASKLLSFDSAGDLIATQEIGVSRGNWAASTAYAERDIIKDTDNNNIYLCITAHTSSGAVPISTNADVAKWVLLVDAASATTSQTAAASSATSAASSATSAASSATSSASSATSSASSASNASSSASAAASSATAAAASADSFDDLYLGAKSSDPSVDNDGDALTTGDIYFNTSANNLRVWNGSAWQVAAVSTSGVLTEISEDTSPQLGGMLDVNGQALGDGTLELLKFSETGSAVNEFTIANAAAGNGPTLSSTGTESDVDINITPKGTGVVSITTTMNPTLTSTGKALVIGF
jgi:hypothetical protein